MSLQHWQQQSRLVAGCASPKRHLVHVWLYRRPEPDRTESGTSHPSHLYMKRLVVKRFALALHLALHLASETGHLESWLLGGIFVACGAHEHNAVHASS